MFDKLNEMIFFRKKKPEASPESSSDEIRKTPASKEPKTAKSLGSIVESRVQTAEGWRRAIEKKNLKKTK